MTFAPRLQPPERRASARSVLALLPARVLSLPLSLLLALVIAACGGRNGGKSFDEGGAARSPANSRAGSPSKGKPADLLGPQSVGIASGAARLRFDFARGWLEARGATDTLTTSFDGDGIDAALDSLTLQLERGRESLGLRRRLGRQLLGDLAEVLQPTQRWRIEVAAFDQSWARASLLGACIAPWSPSGRPVASEHILSLAWGSSFRTGDRTPTGSRASRSPATFSPSQAQGPVLMVAPFRPGRSSLVPDDPDTLLASLRGATARVDLLPRNDSSAGSLRAALEEGGYSMMWLRSDPSLVPDLLREVVHFPALLCISLPASGSSDRWEALLVDLAAQPGRAPRSLLLARWPRKEKTLAAAAAQLVETLSEGEDLGVASLRMRRFLLLQPDVGPRDWAGWVLLGDDRIQVGLKEARWLDRMRRHDD